MAEMGFQNPKTIMILSNSQGTCAGVSLMDSYPSLIENSLKEKIKVHRLLFSGWTIKEFIGIMEDNIISVRPELVVLQIGIVECTRRILSSNQKKIINALPFGRLITYYLFKKRLEIITLRKRLGMDVRVMDIDEFERLLCIFVESLNNKGIKCLIVEIPEISDGGKSLRHPFINNDIFSYNERLKKFDFCTINKINNSTNLFQFNSVHFNCEGHAVMANMLISKINSSLNLGV